VGLRHIPLMILGSLRFSHLSDIFHRTYHHLYYSDGSMSRPAQVSSPR
jgi:hypothetical protein